MPSLYITFIDYTSWLFSDDEMKNNLISLWCADPFPYVLLMQSVMDWTVCPTTNTQIHMFKFSESTKGPHDVIAFGNRAFREVIKLK